MNGDKLLLAVASAYRERRMAGGDDHPAWEAAVATFTKREDPISEEETADRVAALIFEASEVYGQWLYWSSPGLMDTF